MPTNILDGKAIAEGIISDIAKKTANLNQRCPGLAVLQVGDHAASNSYINQKKLMSVKAGMKFQHIKLPASTSEQELIHEINKLNNDNNIDGFLVQLPLPKQISFINILASIDPSKDVDGFHPRHLGGLFYDDTKLAPCTPLGIMLLLQHANITLTAANVVIVGASTIVGQPLAIMLINQQATVTICQKHTQNLNNIVSRADILISATGNVNAIDTNHIKQDAIVIDVGINHTADGKINGDLDHSILSKRAKLYTPVPGGVGPMTVAALLENTWRAYQLNQSTK